MRKLVFCAFFCLLISWGRPLTAQSTNNIKLAKQMPRIYRCPSCMADLANGETNYVVVVGPETVWPGTGVISTRIGEPC